MVTNPFGHKKRGRKKDLESFFLVETLEDLSLNLFWKTNGHIVLLMFEA
jgi:hypothetical protein